MRNGPPYIAPVDVALTNRHGHTYGRGPARNVDGRYGSVTAPPPVYDPYAQALPVYQPKMGPGGTVTTQLVDGHEDTTSPNLFSTTTQTVHDRSTQSMTQAPNHSDAGLGLGRTYEGNDDDDTDMDDMRRPTATPYSHPRAI
jgi:hypothetical protein